MEDELSPYCGGVDVCELRVLLLTAAIRSEEKQLEKQLEAVQILLLLCPPGHRRLLKVLLSFMAPSGPLLDPY
jgi:hypothetical protein